MPDPVQPGSNPAQQTKERGMGDYLSTVGTVLGRYADARRDSAKYQAQASNLRFSAGEMRRQAEEAITASQIQSYEEKQKTALALSRVQAVAAAQGSTVDANTLRLIADFETEGRLSALTALYEGRQKSRALRDSAANAEREAAAQQDAARRSNNSGIGSVIGGIAGFALSSGSPIGAAAGSSIGGALGGLF